MLTARGHEAEHVTGITRGDAPDRELWDYAVEHGAVLATKNDDFSDIVLLGETARVVERFPGVPVWGVDANASFARPGPRIVDGVEDLAAILHLQATGLGPARGIGARRVDEGG